MPERRARADPAASPSLESLAESLAVGLACYAVAFSTKLGAEYAHPNGSSDQDTNGAEHWTLRRWTSDRAGGVTLIWHLRKFNNSGGNGVTGHLFLNGAEIDRATIGAEDTVGVTRLVTATVSQGDLIDLALSPRGTDELPLDGADGSITRLTIAEAFAETRQPSGAESAYHRRIRDSARLFPSTGPEAAYRVPLPPGAYKVTLHFPYPWPDSTGRRVFDVRVEKALLSKSPAGAEAAYVHSAETRVDDGRLDIEFLHAASNNPIISGIEIEAVR